MSDPRRGVTLQSLVADALRDAVDLARKELALFRAEMADNVAGFAKGAGMFVAAAVFAVASIIWLTQAIVYGLALFVPPWLAALIVGGLLALIAGAFVLAGKSLISAASLAPTRTVQSLKRDGEVIAERVP